MGGPDLPIRRATISTACGRCGYPFAYHRVSATPVDVAQVPWWCAYPVYSVREDGAPCDCGGFVAPDLSSPGEIGAGSRRRSTGYGARRVKIGEVVW